MTVKSLNISNTKPQIREFTAYGGSFVGSTNISKKSHVLICGGHASGKTRMIEKLHSRAEEIWRKQIKPYNPTRNVNLLSDKPQFASDLERDTWEFPEPIFLAAADPLTKWVQNAGLEKWWDEHGRFDNASECDQSPRLYKNLPQWQRGEILVHYLKATRAILFIDNADDLNGRKLTIAQNCLHVAFRAVITADDENRLHPTMRKRFLDTKPQIIRLTSEVAYDATGALAYIFMLIAFLAGSPEFAMAIGAFELMKGGRRGAKQK